MAKENLIIRNRKVYVYNAVPETKPLIILSANIVKWFKGCIKLDTIVGWNGDPLGIV